MLATWLRLAVLTIFQIFGVKQVISTNSEISKLKNRVAKLEGQQLKVRLSSSSRGRVEVYHPSYGWGTVCDDDWDINDGHVVCRQLGYLRATAVYQRAHYGQGVGPILLDNVKCTGKEYNLWDCPHTGWNVENCGHNEDASVDCSSEKRIRLSQGSKGRVEVHHQSYGWGTVCDDSWDINDGRVVCRQLGYSRATAVYQSAHYGQGSGPILLDDLHCTGNEKLLWDCPHWGWNMENCGHHEDAGVVCL